MNRLSDGGATIVYILVIWFAVIGALAHVPDTIPDCCWNIEKVKEYFNKHGHILPIVGTVNMPSGDRVFLHDVNDDGECDFGIFYAVNRGLEPIRLTNCGGE